MLHFLLMYLAVSSSPLHSAFAIERSKSHVLDEGFRKLCNQSLRVCHFAQGPSHKLPDLVRYSVPPLY